MAASDFDVELDELKRKSVERLYAAEVFDAPAFEALLRYLRNKSVQIKEEHVVSKQVLQCLLLAKRSIESRSEYLPEVRAGLPIANEFSYLLAIIADGEAYEDREPGVPRII